MSNISAAEALAKLMDGNKRFLTSHINDGDFSQDIRKETFENGQHPYAIVVCCADSRVVPESAFMAGLGEIFTIRVAGNIIARSQLGSIEYAADHLGVHLVLIMGHTGCGAVDATIHGHGEGYTKFLTDEISRMIGEEKDPYKATCLNAKNSVKLVNMYLKPGERPVDKELVVMPCVYHTDTGEVELLN